MIFRYIEMTFITAPYEYFDGCRDSALCKDGRRCLSGNECTDCTLGRCIQLAKVKNSKGFSYSKQGGRCNFCSMMQLTTLQTDRYWTVYTRTGNLGLEIDTFEWILNILWFFEIANVSTIFSSEIKIRLMLQSKQRVCQRLLKWQRGHQNYGRFLRAKKRRKQIVKYRVKLDPK